MSELGVLRSSLDKTWYDICYGFYAHGDPHGQEAILWFQTNAMASMTASSSSPTTSILQSSSSPISLLSSTQLSLYSSYGILSCTEQQWYHLDSIKNLARKNAHVHGAKNRIYEVIYEGQIHQLNQRHIIHDNHLLRQTLKRLSSSSDGDPSLIPLLRLLLQWLQQQLHHPTCTIIAIHASEFTERPMEISHQLLLFLCSIADFIIPAEYFHTTPSSTPSPSGITTEYVLRENINPAEVSFHWMIKEHLTDQLLSSLVGILQPKQQQQSAFRAPPLMFKQSERNRERRDEIDETLVGETEGYGSRQGWRRICLCCLE
jgi:hypothetical protein